MRLNRVLLVLLFSCCFFAWAPSLHGQEVKREPVRKQVVTLKVLTLRFQAKAWEYVFGFLLAPLDGSPFKLPRYTEYVTYSVPFDVNQPLPIRMPMKWTYARSALQSAGDGSQLFHSQLPVKEWENAVVTISGPIPENPEYLLLLFYPEGVIKAEILNKTQFENDAMASAIERFKKETFVNGAYPKKEAGEGW